MTGPPGWYLTNPLILHVLPVAERYGSRIGEERSDLMMETELGKRWVYNQFKRQVRRMTFRCSESQLADFRALHDAVGGQEFPFFWVVDTDDSGSGVLYVRKEKDFLPVELTEPATESGVIGPLYDYTLELSTEPTDAELSVLA